MISTLDLSLNFGGRKLFEEVNVKFTPGNCYGLIGANGAGKSTFLKILSGQIDSHMGRVLMNKGQRLSILKQDHFEFDDVSVLKTVLKGNAELLSVMEEKDAIYAKPDFSDEDGIRAGELEEQFAAMNGYEAESEGGILLAGLGIPAHYNNRLMKELTGGEKVKVLLAQALFGRPDVLLLDEPTNHLDIKAIKWLEGFLYDFPNTVVVVSHDRHFLNQVCTHIADIDFGKITVYAGNYDFWRKSSELSIKLQSEQNKKSEDKVKDLKAFIQRFSANASKSKQATSRQRQLEKIEIKDLPRSSRKYPYVHFKPHREAGKDMLIVDGISKTIEGKKILNKVSFNITAGEKVVFLSKSDTTITTLFQILTGEMQPDSGKFSWGVTTSRSYFPQDNSSMFESKTVSITDWLREYSEVKDEDFIRGFLGKMLFSGEEALKKVNVLSGGEKVRCVLSKMMLSGANVLIMDSPTAHLDLESITSLNEGLIRFPGTLLFTSHDHEFIQTLAGRIIEIDEVVTEDKITTFDDYLASKI